MMDDIKFAVRDSDQKLFMYINRTLPMERDDGTIESHYISYRCIVSHISMVMEHELFWSKFSPVDSSDIHYLDREGKCINMMREKILDRITK